MIPYQRGDLWKLFPRHQQEVFLHRLADNAPFSDLVSLIVNMAEEHTPGTRCMIHIHDGVVADSRPVTHREGGGKRYSRA